MKKHRFEVTRKGLRLYSSFNRKYFPIKILQIIFDRFSPYFNLWMSAEIVTALYEGRPGESLFLLVLITLLGNLFIQIASAALNRMSTIQLEILNNQEAAAFNRKTLSLDYDKLENPEIRQHRRKIIENSYVNFYGVTSLRINIENLAGSLASIGFSLIFFFEMFSLIARHDLQWLGVGLFIAMFVCVILNIFAHFLLNRKAAAGWKEVGAFMLEENRLGRGTHTNGLDNRIYRQQEIISRLDKNFSRAHLRIFQHRHNVDICYSILPALFSRLTELCAYLITCVYCLLGVFPLGSVIKYVGYLGMFFSWIQSLLSTLDTLTVNEPFLQTYLDYFDIPNDMYQGSLAVEKRSDKKFDIQFKDVSFRYQGAADYALKNISLSLGVGERLAVVGMNGSGKTTFIKLLCRLYDPTEGEIYMNDFNIRKYDYRQYLDIFSVVFQDFKLLALPLGNNVASAEEWDEEKAEHLLEKVGLGERYAQLSKGLRTPLYKLFDEDGVNVSGGEAQKIALARALYRDTPFIILDEPTAALDPIAEAEIYSRFDEIVGDKTAIYISHRLSSCRFCDRIAVFDKGRIVQLGTHEELLADVNGKYYELWQAQAQYYVH